jgi:hypothetical protein
VKLKRPTLIGTAAAAVGAAALAGGLAVATLPAHASTSGDAFNVPFQLCDHLSTKDGKVAIDVWTDGVEVDKVASGTCGNKPIFAVPNGVVQLFLDGHGKEISELAFINAEPFTDTVTGTITDVHEAITINH